MNTQSFFKQPANSLQLQYEALRMFYVDNASADEVARKFNIGASYFKKIRFQFSQQLKNKNAHNYFFHTLKKGPKKRSTNQNVIESIVALRKQNHSVTDIRSALESRNIKISIITIDKILKDEGFAPLSRRTKDERRNINMPAAIEAPEARPYCPVDEEINIEQGAGVLLFLPLLQQKKLIDIISTISFPETKIISAESSILSFLALKLYGRLRYSHDELWKFNRCLGLFAKLNVLPKNATLSSYSYRVDRSMNRRLLMEMSKVFVNDDGDFNLDFKAIPHWGDESILEKNWCGARQKAMKSILSLIVQNPSSGYLTYTDAELKHSDETDAILDFVDFWTSSSGHCPNMLIFDSKLTSYENLHKLNTSKERIKFLTLRRRGSSLLKKVDLIPEDSWKKVKIEGKNRKHRIVKVYESTCNLKKYEGEVRQIIITDHGRKKPAFLITNDFEMKTADLVRKYARRWLVELDIAEQIDFFQLNHPSSSIVVKVDFDVTISLLAHNLYRDLAQNLPGFENCTASTIHKKFVDNGAKISIKDSVVQVDFKKKTHLPLLLNIPWVKEQTDLSWHGLKIKFGGDTVS